jgi:hypothetical protein
MGYDGAAPAVTDVLRVDLRDCSGRRFRMVAVNHGTGFLPHERRVLHYGYIAVWILVLLYAEVPWSRVLLDW